jgi:hypothetical protein
MKIYLRAVNPVVAALVPGLRRWAATHDEGKFKPEAILAGSISTYFVAKGLFCSATLVLVGKIVALMMERAEKQRQPILRPIAVLPLCL